MRRHPSFACWRLPNAPIWTILPAAPANCRDGHNFNGSDVCAACCEGFVTVTGFVSVRSAAADFPWMPLGR
jgi:hypothetical protein